MSLKPFAISTGLRFPDGTTQTTAYTDNVRSYLLHEYGDPDPFTSPSTITIDGMDYGGGEVVTDGAFGSESSRVTVCDPGTSIFAMVALNTNINAVYYNGETGSDGDGNDKIVSQGLENYRDGYYSWYNKFTGSGDPSITQIVIAKNPTYPSNVTFYNRTTDTNNDDFTVEGLIGATTIIVLNLYWDDTDGPGTESSIEVAAKAFIDGAIYDGGPTELTDLGAIRAAFYNRSSDMKTAIEGWEGDILFIPFEFFNDTFQAVLPTGGSGTGAVLEIQVNSGIELYYTYQDVLLPGSGYQIGDTLTVSGSVFGGISPDNDVTITVNNVSSPFGGITSFSANGTPPDQVWPSSYIHDGNNDIYDIGNFIGTDITRVTAVATLTYDDPEDEGSGTTTFQKLNILSANKPINVGQWAWFPDDNRGAFINWELGYGVNNEASYVDSYTGYPSTTSLTYDYHVDVNKAHLDVNGDGSWYIGSGYNETYIRSIDETGPGQLDIEIIANDIGWLFDREGNLTLPAGGDIKDSSGNSVLNGIGDLVGDGYVSGTGSKRTVYTDWNGYQGGESDGQTEEDWFTSSDVVGVSVGDTIKFNGGELRTITDIATIDQYTTRISWSGPIVNDNSKPRYPLTIISADYSEEVKPTARIKPDADAASTFNQFIDIYNGLSAPVDNRHVHMTGHVTNVELFLGTDNNFVSSKEAGNTPAGVNLHSENDVTVTDSNLRITRKGSTWVSVYGDTENRNLHNNSYDLAWSTVTSDEFGNYYVGGEATSYAEAIVNKYGPDGNLIWSKYVNGNDISGWQFDGVAYNDGEVATLVQTDYNRTYNYYKLTVHDSETGEVKTTTDIYDDDGHLDAYSMIYHDSLGWTVVGRTRGEAVSSSALTGVGATGMGIIELLASETILDSQYPSAYNSWNITGTNISGSQYLMDGVGMYNNVAVTTVTGTGHDAIVTIYIDYNQNRYYMYNITTSGDGYNNDDQLKITGDLLGGVPGNTNINATPAAITGGSQIVAYFDKATYPDLYDTVKNASFTVSYNSGGPYDVILAENPAGDNFAITIDSSDATIAQMTFNTVNGNDLFFLANASGSSLNGWNGDPTGIPNRARVRINMGAMGYGGTDFTGGNFTLIRTLNDRPWIWNSTWTKYLDPIDTGSWGRAYCVAQGPNGDLFVGGNIGNTSGTSFVWKLDSAGNTVWAKTINNDTNGVYGIAVSNIDGSIYASTNYSSVNKLSSNGNLLARIQTYGMWGGSVPEVKLSVEDDGNEYVYVGMVGGAVWTGDSGLMLSKLTTDFKNVWGRDLWNVNQSLYINYDTNHTIFTLNKGRASIVGYGYIPNTDYYQALIYTLSTTDDFVPYSDNGWVAEHNGNMTWITVDGYSTYDLISHGAHASNASTQYATEQNSLTWCNYAFQSRVLNLNLTSNGIVGVESIEFTDGGRLDHNPSDIPPSVFFDPNDTSWNYTLQLSDRGRFILNQTIPNDSYCQDLYIYVPRNDDVAFPVGTVITLINASESNYRIYVYPQDYNDIDGWVRIWAAGSGNQNPSKWSFQGMQTATLMKISTNAWILTANNIQNED